MQDLRDHTSVSSALSDLESASEIIIDITGSANSHKEELFQYYTSHDIRKADRVNKLEQKLKLDNEKYIIKFLISSGVEGLLGVADVRFRSAQGCIFVYNIANRESFELFKSSHECTERAKDMGQFPYLLIGMGIGVTNQERQVSTAEGERAAESANCQFVEFMEEHLIHETIVGFVKETIHFYSRLSRERKTEQTDKLTERFLGIVGDIFVGKTSLVRVFNSNKPTTKYLSTSSCSPSTFKYQGKEEMFLVQVCDTPGNFSSYPRDLASNFQGLIFVYSVASKSSFECLTKLRDVVLSAKGVSKLPSVLIATKCDLPKSLWQVSEDEGRALSERFQCSFHQVSLFDEDLRISDLIMPGLLADIKKSLTTVIEGVMNMDRSGYPILQKTSKSVKKFKSRHYVVRDSVLYESPSPDVPIGPKTPRLVLSEDTTIEVFNASAQQVFPFEVRNSSGHMIMSAASEEDRAAWIDTITINIASAQFLLNLSDDVVRVMLWDIISTAELNAPTEGSPAVTPVETTKKSSSSSLLGKSKGSIFRRKPSSSKSPGLLPKKDSKEKSDKK